MSEPRKIVDPDMQGGAEWRGDLEDGREARQTTVKCPPNNAGADALREAFEAVRWRCKRLNLYCAACDYMLSNPEVHAPGCIVGKVIGKGEKHESN